MSTIYRLDLTPHERAALLTVIAGYLTHEEPVEVSIDAITGEEIAPSALLARVLNLEPRPEERELGQCTCRTCDHPAGAHVNGSCLICGRAGCWS